MPSKRGIGGAQCRSLQALAALGSCLVSLTWTSLAISVHPTSIVDPQAVALPLPPLFYHHKHEKVTPEVCPTNYTRSVQGRSSSNHSCSRASPPPDDDTCINTIMPQVLAQALPVMDGTTSSTSLSAGVLEPRAGSGETIIELPLSSPPLAFTRPPRATKTTSPTHRHRRGALVRSGTHTTTTTRSNRHLNLVTVSNVASGIGTFIPLPNLLDRAPQSPFDPHPLPLVKALPFFNGWCIRVVDHEGELAFALIIGSFRHKGADSYTEHYVALTYADKSGNLFTAHAFPDPDSVTISADHEGPKSRSNFTWRSLDVGELHIEDNRGRFDFKLPGFSASGTFYDRVPWNSRRPNSDGPEGWLGKTPLLPCRYFVHSLASRTTFRLRLTAGSTDEDMEPREVQGRGLAHMETNYGNHFPSGWIWAQCVSALRDVKLVLVGGKFEIGCFCPTTWVIGYRSPRFDWNFRTTDMDVIKAGVDYTGRRLSLQAVSRSGKHKLEIEISAPEGSFGSPIYIPTPRGFSCIPGCRESFIATAKITATDVTTAKMVVKEEHNIELCALEFGGMMQRL